WRQLAHMYAVSRPPLLSALLQEQGVTETTAFADRLRSAAPSERFNLVVAHVQSELANILGLADLPDPNAGFFDLGMDSLSATRLAGRISAAVEMNVSARQVFDATTVAELAQVVVTGRDGDTDNPIPIPTDDRGVEAIVSPAQERVLAGEDITRDHNVVTSTSVLE
ncbi:MAG: acyl carrier protein, partial [bacterium]|nr:acyl carrier protein [bacterium]